MDKVYTVAPTTVVPKKQPFDEESAEYYPPAFCEFVHASNAVYVAVALQTTFLVTLSILYHYFEENDFIHAVEVFRPALLFIGGANLVGIVFALAGAILEKKSFISFQSLLLTALVFLSDMVALALVTVMAIGSRSKFTQSVPSYLVNDKKFEALLGPFWIYLCAILFHMLAASITCIIGINRRYSKYLTDKNYRPLGPEAVSRNA
ncbi:unnamed protein product [Bursaphelenchus okinawaensis]|uniref:MARVEL domain-containing protein n=1 Tax=Bursaphelenchus okinawaensis TaxID=465554 RepID=A0A811LKY5_9BILA|nr:unnamed protein product [Bursaphelenchus okinawaensis]CAG9124349.1 unnamed protein product [Bursaphelenchus okinawaensis]